jgi:hypothetical protein
VGRLSQRKARRLQLEETDPVWKKAPQWRHSSGNTQLIQAPRSNNFSAVMNGFSANIAKGHGGRWRSDPA